jgi:hypothetical protein
MFNKLKRLSKGRPLNTPEVLFDNISRLNADESMVNLIKFMINYGFYKFGVEIALLTFIVVINIRHELISLFYFILLVILALSSRKNAHRFWKFAVICVTMSMIFQCLLLFLYSTVKECEDNLKFIDNESIRVHLKFLYRNLELLYDEPGMLVADFILLMVLVCQVVQGFKTFGGSDSSIFHRHESSTRKELAMEVIPLKVADAIDPLTWTKQTALTWAPLTTIMQSTLSRKKFEELSIF